MFKTASILTKSLSYSHIQLHLSEVRKLSQLSFFLSLHIHPTTSPSIFCLPSLPLNWSKPPLCPASETTVASQHPSAFFLFLYRSVFLTTMRVSFWASKLVLAMSCLTLFNGFPVYLEKNPNSFAMAHKVPHNSASAHLTNLTCKHCSSFIRLFPTTLGFSQCSNSQNSFLPQNLFICSFLFVGCVHIHTFHLLLVLQFSG